MILISLQPEYWLGLRDCYRRRYLVAARWCQLMSYGVRVVFFVILGLLPFFSLKTWERIAGYLLWPLGVAFALMIIFGARAYWYNCRHQQAQRMIKGPRA